MTPKKREKLKTQSIFLCASAQVEAVRVLVGNLPLDPETPLEVVFREQVKKRRLSLNAAYWAGPLHDIEERGWYRGHQFPAGIWHSQFKELFLPDENDPEFDPEEVLEGYHKWVLNPWKDTRELLGSTTMLTDKGMRKFILQVMAYASSEFGVIFTERAEPWS